MANNYFSFKQFSVSQDKCAMKVGTDGVLLGAWATIDLATSALDVGTGTGLIALMLAQRSTLLYIDAIDIDNAAIEQAEENMKQSPFSNRIVCQRNSLQIFAENREQKYDLIVSNPPYFIGSLKSPDSQRSLARHTDSLPIEDLIALSSKLLSYKGRLCIIFPHEHKPDLVKIGEEYNLHVAKMTNVYPTPTSKPKRILIEFSKETKPRIEDNLVLERDRHIYSEEFTSLVKDFYLKL